MLATKNHPMVKIILTLAALALGLFLLLDLIGAGEEQDEIPPVLTPSVPAFLDNKGSIRNAQTNTPAGTFSDRGHLFVVFEQNKDVYLTYYNTEGKWLDTPIALGLRSDYGVEAATLTNPDKPNETIACLFLKKGDQELGEIEYTCTPIRYNPATQAPQLAFESPSVLDLKMSVSWSDLVSVVQSPNRRDEFNLVLNEWYWQTVEAPMNQIKRVDCRITQKTDLSDHKNLLNKICTLTVSSTMHRVRNFGPAMIATPAPETGPNLFYTFFGARDEQDNIFYSSIDPQIEPYERILLTDRNNKSRNTNKRMSAYFLEGPGRSIFVAYKNAHDTVIRFSRISLDDWLQNPLTPGNQLWTHCELKEFDESSGQMEYIAHSHEGPSLFEHRGHLYLLYSDALHENRLTFLRIDFMVPDTSACKGVM